jgi:hypothetical protein
MSFLQLFTESENLFTSVTRSRPGDPVTADSAPGYAPIAPDDARFDAPTLLDSPAFAPRTRDWSAPRSAGHDGT